MSDGHEQHVKDFVAEVTRLEDHYGVVLSEITDSTFSVWYKNDKYEVDAPVND
jgi:hypothetical protein